MRILIIVSFLSLCHCIKKPHSVIDIDVRAASEIDKKFEQERDRGRQLALDSFTSDKVSYDVYSYATIEALRSKLNSSDVKKRAIGCIGPSFSPNFQALAAEFRNLELACVSPTATDSNLFGASGPFKTMAIDSSSLGQRMAQFVVDDLGVKSVANIWVENEIEETDRQTLNAFVKRLKELKIELLELRLNTSDREDIRRRIEGIEKKDWALVFVPHYYAQAFKIIQNVFAEKFGKDFLGLESWDNRNFSPLENSTRSVFFPQVFYSQSERFKKFSDLYRKKYMQEPTTAAALMYLAVLTVIEASEKSGDSKSVAAQVLTDKRAPLFIMERTGKVSKLKSDRY